jgi:hypothetical protein
MVLRAGRRPSIGAAAPGAATGSAYADRQSCAPARQPCNSAVRRPSLCERRRRLSACGCETGSAVGALRMAAGREPRQGGRDGPAREPGAGVTWLAATRVPVCSWDAPAPELTLRRSRVGGRHGWLPALARGTDVRAPGRGHGIGCVNCPGGAVGRRGAGAPRPSADLRGVTREWFRRPDR